MNNFEQFIKFNENTYIIDLFTFDSSESFSLSLMEFLGQFSVLNRNKNEDCTVYVLDFTDCLRTIKEPFLFPFVDKAITFNHIYDTFKLSLNSKYIYLIINNF